jgi:anaerobic selenocysteine-containing dehydrogenase
VLFVEGADAHSFSFAPLAAARSLPPQAPAKEYPFALSFGHSLYYWHQNTLIRHSETLKREYGVLLLDYPDGFVEINDADAKTLSLRDSQRIKLVSAAGEANTVARVTSEVRQGTVFVPFFLQDVMRTLGQKNTAEQCAGLCVRIEKAV